MGLRALKIERTRAQIVEVAQDLFLEQGYPATTMEQVAEAAEVGTSTLYRYFPSKELLLLDPFTRALTFGRLLAARPDDEPLAEALGAVLRAASPQGDLELARFVALWQIVESEPGPRSRLWEVFDQAKRELAEGIAQRTGRAVDDLEVVFAARTLLVVHDLAAQRWSARTRPSWSQTVDRLLEELPDVELALPR